MQGRPFFFQALVFAIFPLLTAPRSIKIVTIVGLLILAFIIDLGGAPTVSGAWLRMCTSIALAEAKHNVQHDRLGFRYWQHPGALATVVAKGNTGRFLAFFSTLINAAFSYGGVEMVAVAGGEAENRKFGRGDPKQQLTTTSPQKHSKGGASCVLANSILLRPWFARNWCHGIAFYELALISSSLTSWSGSVHRYPSTEPLSRRRALAMGHCHQPRND